MATLERLRNDGWNREKQTFHSPSSGVSPQSFPSLSKYGFKRNQNLGKNLVFEPKYAPVSSFDEAPMQSFSKLAANRSSTSGSHKLGRSSLTAPPVNKSEVDFTPQQSSVSEPCIDTKRMDFLKSIDASLAHHQNNGVKSRRHSQQSLRSLQSRRSPRPDLFSTRPESRQGAVMKEPSNPSLTTPDSQPSYHQTQRNGPSRISRTERPSSRQSGYVFQTQSHPRTVKGANESFPGSKSAPKPLKPSEILSRHRLSTPDLRGAIEGEIHVEPRQLSFPGILGKSTRDSTLEKVGKTVLSAFSGGGVGSGDTERQTKRTPQDLLRTFPGLSQEKNPRNSSPTGGEAKKSVGWRKLMQAHKAVSKFKNSAALLGSKECALDRRKAYATENCQGNFEKTHIRLERGRSVPFSDIKLLKDYFDTININGDGVVSRNELRLYNQNKAWGENAGRVEAILSQLQCDFTFSDMIQSAYRHFSKGDIKLILEAIEKKQEVKRMVEVEKKRLQVNVRSELEDLKQHWLSFSSEDGVVTRQLFHGFLKALGDDRDKEEVEELFETVATSGSGTIQKKEFALFWINMFRLEDPLEWEQVEHQAREIWGNEEFETDQ